MNRTRRATTREELIEAAGQVFAERGFRAASVREICRRADANVAAVSYHFGGKKALYRETLVETHARTIGAIPMPQADPADPKQSLRNWLHWFLTYLLDDQSKPTWFPRLMMRELADPSPALDQLVDASIRPVFTEIQSLVAAILPDHAPPQLLATATQCVVGTCVFQVQSRPIIERLHTPNPDLQAHIEGLAKFALGGLEALIKNQQEAP